MTRIKGISVLLLETPLTRSKYISPHTHTHTTSYANIENLLHIRVQTNPSVLTLVPLPKIDEIYAKLEGSTIYSTFDMRSGYYHLELNKESQPKSAFVVGGPKGGKWEFKRCPFGLTQAPAYFQMLVNKVLEGLEFTFGYLDEILIFSKIWKNIFNMFGHFLSDCIRQT